MKDLIVRKSKKTPYLNGQNERLANPHRKRRPIFESLEERALLTSYIVDTLDDSNAADGKISLREALIAANTNLPFVDAPQGGVGPLVIDSIRFAASLNGQIITLSGIGSLPISDAIDLADSNSLPVVIDGGGQGVFTIANNTPSASLSNVVIRNGQSTEGGGLRVGSNSSVRLSNIVFQNNRADNGGAIFNAGGSLTIIETTISNNRTTSTSGSGGGIFVQSGSVILINSQISFNSAVRAGGGIEITNGTLNLTRTNLVSNDVNGLIGAANPGNGGGLHVSGIANVSIEGGVVFGNSAASEGGGLWNQAGSTLSIRNTFISRNRAFGNDATNGGGGVFNNGGIVNVTGASTVISNNVASGTAGSGGGVFNDAGGQVNITDATIASNLANRAGGGIEAVAGTTTNLNNVVLRLNNAGVAPDAVAAPGNGGGFHITGAGNASIVGGEVSDNVAAQEGGGLWNGSGTMTVNGTLITRNVAKGNAADDGGGGVFNNAGTLNVTGATISNNLANGTSGSGGGVFSLAGAVTLAASTLAFNSANRAGGGIEIVNGTLNVASSVFFANDANGGAGASNPGNGGAIHTSSASNVIVSGGSFVSNQATTEGGAVWIQRASSLTAISNVVFANNRAHGNASDDGGGAIFNNGGIVSLSGVFVFGNVSDGTSGSGGGLFNFGGSIVIGNSFIGSNVANRAGGGVEDNGGTIHFENVTLTANRAIGLPGNGGGLHVTGASNISFVGSTITQNFATLEGGGLWNSSAGSISLNGSTVDGNISSFGGGVFGDGVGGSIVINTSTVSRNVANESGGGVLIEGGAVQATNSTISSNFARIGGGIQLLGGNADLASVTIAANTSNQGGGINVAGGVLNFLNTIIATNIAITGVDISGAVVSKGNNLIGNGSGATITGVLNGNLIGINARLGSLQNNGGATQTHALLLGSPAIDAANVTSPIVDQRGVVRPQGAGVDIGAFERSLSGGSQALRQTADTDRDGFVTPLDVLIIVNNLNSSLEQSPSDADLDVDSDGVVTPLDVLLVINVLNRGVQSDSRAEPVISEADSEAHAMLMSQITLWLDDFKDEDHDTWQDADTEESLLNALANYLVNRTGDETFLFF